MISLKRIRDFGIKAYKALDYKLEDLTDAALSLEKTERLDRVLHGVAGFRENGPRPLTALETMKVTRPASRTPPGKHGRFSVNLYSNPWGDAGPELRSDMTKISRRKWDVIDRTWRGLEADHPAVAKNISQLHLNKKLFGDKHLLGLAVGDGEGLDSAIYLATGRRMPRPRNGRIVYGGRGPWRSAVEAIGDTFTHEFGHHVKFNMKHEDSIQGILATNFEITDLMRNHLGTGRRKKAAKIVGSTYADTNYDELAAEAFIHARRGRKVDRRVAAFTNDMAQRADQAILKRQIRSRARAQALSDLTFKNR